MNAWQFFLIFMLNIMYLNVSNGYKCSFQKDRQTNNYKCEVFPDNANRNERRSSRKNDNSVTELNFNGNTNEIWKLSQSNFPFCQRFENLENCYISDVQSIDDNLFHNCENLDVIWIKRTEITEISNNLFTYNSKLVELKLEENEFTTLPENLFIEQQNLEILSLYWNQINFLPPNIFQPLGKLTSLSISSNEIKYLDANWFWNLKNLKVLDLSNNNITNLPSNAFKNLNNLEQLQLYENQLTVIHSDSFGMHNTLRILRLSNNSINAIDPKIAGKMVNVNIFMERNVCSYDVISLPREKDTANRKLRNCFNNYEKRIIQDDIICGTNGRFIPLIIEGNNTSPDEFKWNAALVNNKRVVFCGGTLIMKKYVLTAAHCIKGKEYSYEYTTRNVSVLIGVRNLDLYYDGMIDTKRLRNITVHPDWNMDVNMYDADIAILELYDEILNIQPICLAGAQSVIHHAKNGIAVGFGMTGNGNYAKIAQKLNIPIYAYHNCTRNINDIFMRSLVSPRTFCGGPGDGRGVCKGDSGSGVYVYHNGQFYLKGIVSVALPGDVNMCNVKTQAVFTDVTRFYDWIKKEILGNVTSKV